MEVDRDYHKRQNKLPHLSELALPQPYPVKGFSNHPNSCFMNSIVQLIINSPLADELERGDGPVSKCVARVAHQYRHSQEPVVPLFELKDALNSLREGGLYRHERIYDAAEFFRELGELLDPSIQQIFTGQRLVHRRCVNCGLESENPETFQSLTFGSDELFDFPYRDRRYLHQWIDATEHIENCFCGEVAMLVNTHILEFPRALLMEVSRAQPGRKCHKYAFFAERFEVVDRYQLRHNYLLWGVLYHKGLQSDGHYTCKVRAYDGSFYYVDDEHVEESGLEERSATVTLLLYIQDKPVK